MNPGVLFFKLIYIIRKRLINLKFWYLVSEYRYLFPGRIILPKDFQFYPLPHLHFDGSQSKLIVHNNVGGRGFISFVFLNNGVIEIGENTYLNNCFINCMDKIWIGPDCLLAEGVKLYDHNHGYSDTYRPKREQGFNTAPIVIERNCWLGANVVVLKGVTIGENSVIGAGCVVFKSVPANSLMIVQAGNQIIKPLPSITAPVLS